MSFPHHRAPDRLSPSSVALVPPSSRLWHSDQNLLEKCSHPHTCPSPGMFHSTNRSTGSQLLCFCRSDATGSRTPHGLLTGRLARRFAVRTRQGYDERRRVSLAWEKALQRHNRCCVVWMWRRCHRFPLCIGKVFQSLSALGLHVACLLAVEALSLIVALCFLGRFVLCILGLVFALDVLAVFALGFAPSCIGDG